MMSSQKLSYNFSLWGTFHYAYKNRIKSNAIEGEPIEYKFKHDQLKFSTWPQSTM